MDVYEMYARRSSAEIVAAQPFQVLFQKLTDFWTPAASRSDSSDLWANAYRIGKQKFQDDLLLGGPLRQFSAE